MNDAFFHQKLISVMTDNKFDRPVSNQKSGKLDSRKIYKIDRSPKIFKKSIERKGKHYNVSLVVDVSGSMSGNRIEMAAKAAAMLAKHLRTIGINYEIMAFNTVMYQLKTFDQKPPKESEIEETLLNLVDGYSGASQMIVNSSSGLVYHNTHPEYAKHVDTAGWHVSYATSWNNDGEAIYLTRRRLEKMKGERIMIVLSDGQPEPFHGYRSQDNPKMKYNDYSLEKEVLAAIKAKIHFVSVGINYDGITRYYPKENCVVIKDLKDLYPGIIKKLQKQIKRG